MRPFRLVVGALLLAGSARADIITRAAAAGEGGGAQSTMENDLIAWAGAPKAISLPDLLQSAVRFAPALQNARLDIEIAEAQIAQTWARHDWRLSSRAPGRRRRASSRACRSRA